jgi:hypothetical protein
MATKKQRTAARNNIKKAASAAKRKQTLKETTEKNPARARKTGGKSQTIAAVISGWSLIKNQSPRERCFRRLSNWIEPLYQFDRKPE